MGNPSLIDRRVHGNGKDFCSWIDKRRATTKPGPAYSSLYSPGGHLVPAPQNQRNIIKFVNCKPRGTAFGVWWPENYHALRSWRRRRTVWAGEEGHAVVTSPRRQFNIIPDRVRTMDGHVPQLHHSNAENVDGSAVYWYIKLYTHAKDSFLYDQQRMEKKNKKVIG